MRKFLFLVFLLVSAAARAAGPIPTWDAELVRDFDSLSKRYSKDPIKLRLLHIELLKKAYAESATELLKTYRGLKSVPLVEGDWRSYVSWFNDNVSDADLLDAEKGRLNLRLLANHLTFRFEAQRQFERAGRVDFPVKPDNSLAFFAAGLVLGISAALGIPRLRRFLIRRRASLS